MVMSRCGGPSMVFVLKDLGYLYPAPGTDVSAQTSSTGISCLSVSPLPLDLLLPRTATTAPVPPTRLLAFKRSGKGLWCLSLPYCCLSVTSTTLVSLITFPSSPSSTSTCRPHTAASCNNTPKIAEGLWIS